MIGVGDVITTVGDTVEEGIEIMFKQIEDDVNNP